MHATRRSAWIALCAAWVAVPAGAAPSPTSAACQHALDELRAIESRVIAARQGAASAPLPVDELKARRADAARACLGGRGDPPPPTARALPPLTLPPRSAVAPLPAPATRPVAPPTPLAPPPPPPKPVAITQCDAGGCWASDGIWRPKVGGTLGGPRGLCSTQGAVAHCP